MPGGELRFVDDPNLPAEGFEGRCVAVEPPHLLELEWGDDVVRIELSARRRRHPPRVPRHDRRASPRGPHRVRLAPLPRAPDRPPRRHVGARDGRGAAGTSCTGSYLDAVGGERHVWGTHPQPDGARYQPLKSGGRRSPKALMPSAMSAVAGHQLLGVGLLLEGAVPAALGAAVHEPLGHRRWPWSGRRPAGRPARRPWRPARRRARRGWRCPSARSRPPTGRRRGTSAPWPAAGRRCGGAGSSRRRRG